MSKGVRRWLFWLGILFLLGFIVALVLPNIAQVHMGPRPPNCANSLASDRSYLYGVSWDRMLTVRSKADLEVVVSRKVGGFKGYGPAICQDQQNVYVASPLGQLHVFAKDGFRLVGETDKNVGPARKAAVVADLLYIAGGDKRIRVFDKTTLKRIKILPPAHNAICCITADDKYIYSSGHDDQVTVRARVTDEDLFRLQVRDTCVVVMTDPRNVYLGVDNAKIIILPKATIGREVRRAGQLPAVFHAKC